MFDDEAVRVQTPGIISDYGFSHFYAILGLGALLLTLSLVHLLNQPLFHVISELFSSFIAFGVFLVCWNSRHRSTNSFFVFLGIGFFFVAGFDLLHALTIGNSGLVIGSNANASVHFVLAARVVEASGYVLAALFAGRLAIGDGLDALDQNVQIAAVFAVYGLFAVAALATAFSVDAFPDVYRSGYGVTDFKLFVEALVTVGFVASLSIVYGMKGDVSDRVYYYLLAGVGLALLSEFPFVMYRYMGDTFNMVGHYVKVTRFYVLYLAVIKVGIREPQEVIYKRLQDAKEREELLGSILRHDLSNNLQVVQGSHELLRDRVPEDGTEDLERAIRATDDASDLIQKVRTLASVSSIDSPRRIDLDAAVREAIDQGRPLARERDMTLTYEAVDADVWASPLLDEAIKNVVQNAIVHSGGSEVRITGAVRGNDVRVTVEDDGVGIPTTVQQELFSHGDRSTRKDGDIGLLLVREIVESCGGSIDVSDSELGGARFDILLPNAD